MLSEKPLFVFLIIFFWMSLAPYFMQAQDQNFKHFYTELHLGIKYNFGPTEDQAELMGGYDYLSYDSTQHYSPGFKVSMPIDLVAGYNFDNTFHIESTLSYYKLDMALIQTFNRSEYPFLIADMFSAKVSSLFRFNDEDIDSTFGVSTGISVGAVFPLSDDINDETKNYFGIKNFDKNLELFFELNVSCYLPLQINGWYLTAGTSLTLPWLIGSIGEIEMQSGSSYKIVRNDVLLYSISGYLGVGCRL